MTRRAMLAAVCVALITVSGCGNSPDSLMKEQIKLMEQLCDAMEKNDEAKIKDLEEKMKEHEKKLDALKLSEEDKKKLTDKYKPEIEKLMKRMFEVAFKKMGQGMGGMPGMPGMPPGIGDPASKAKQ